MCVSFRRHDTFCKHICNFIFVWISAIAFGAWLASIIGNPFLSQMRGIILEPVSIVGLVIAIFLPLFFSVLLYHFRRPFLFLMVCFLKTAAFVFTGILVTNSFPTGGWLVRLMLLAHDYIVILVFFWQWLNIHDQESSSVWFNTYICLIVGLVAAGIDYLIVSPLLQGLF